MTNTCVICIAEVALHSWFIMSRASGVLSKKPVSMYPALLNTSCTSMSLVASAILSTYPGAPRLTPILRNFRSPNDALSSSKVSSSSGSWRATSTTFTPCFASANAMDLPIPLEEPVTSAHSASYFFFRFCVGSSETISFGTQYVPKTIAESSAPNSTAYSFTVPASMESDMGGGRGRRADKCSRASARRV